MPGQLACSWPTGRSHAAAMAQHPLPVAKHHQPSPPRSAKYAKHAHARTHTQEDGCAHADLVDCAWAECEVFDAIRRDDDDILQPYTAEPAHREQLVLVLRTWQTLSSAARHRVGFWTSQWQAMAAAQRRHDGGRGG